MDKHSAQDSINPAKLRLAIEEHFRNRSAEQIVARAEQLRPVDNDEEAKTGSLAVKAAEASWLFMVCRDDTTLKQAILFAARLVDELKDVNESVEGAMVGADIPAVISLQHKRMLVSQPQIVAGVLKGVVKSTKFQEMMVRLQKWATQSPDVPPKAELMEVSTIFASLAPILEESAL